MAMSETISAIDSKSVDRAGTHNCTLWVWNITQTKSNMAAGCHLEKSIWRYNSAVRWPIWIEIWYADANSMHMMMNSSKSKPEVKFQYDERPFSETGSSNNSAVYWDISSCKYVHDIRANNISTFLNESRHYHRCSTGRR